MKLTNEKLEMMLEIQEAFEDKVTSIIKEKYEIEQGKALRFDEMKDITYENNTVEAVLIFYRNCSCCPDDEETYTFPKEWLFSETWQEGYREELIRKKEKIQKQKEETERKRQEAKENQEKAQYEALKEKFDLTKKQKKFLIVFYNRFANQTQTAKIEAENAFRAGRTFYRKHNRKAYHACIELIEEI